jgi:ankyrin repeat protein
MNLADAIKANDPEETRKALAKVKDINRDLPHDLRPIFVAARDGRAKVIPVLLEAGANPHFEKLPAGAALAQAADHGRVDALRALLKHLRNWPAKELSAAAERAATWGDLECLALLHEAEADLQAAVQAAVAGGLGSVVRWCLERGVDPNIERPDPMNDSTQSLLHVAARHASPAAAALLIKAGADVNARDGADRTPLMVAAENEPQAAMDRAMLRARLQEAAERGQNVRQIPAPDSTDFTVVDALLDANADPTLKDKNGSDALRIFMSAYGGMLNAKLTQDDDEFYRLQHRLIQQLHQRLKSGAAPAGGNASEALLEAARRGDAIAMAAEIARGGDVRARTVGGASVLALAVSSGNADAVRAAIAGGADVEDDRRLHPLMSAAGCGHLEIVRALVEAGADVNRLEPDSMYPRNALWSAKVNHKLDVVKYLKSVGARYPLPPGWKPPQPGVAHWENFEDLLVRADATTVAAAIAKLIKGKVKQDAYGQEVDWSEPSYVVLRAKGLDWTNVSRVPNNLWRYREGNAYDAFASKLAEACNASVVWVGYSDAAGAGEIVRYEPDGTQQKADGWDDPDLLEEAIGAMEEAGEDIPDHMRHRLKELQSDDPPQTEGIEQLARRERFFCAGFGLYAEKGKPCLIEFVDYPRETFDSVIFITA